MGARQCAAMERAIKLVQKGMGVYQAAAKAGVSKSGLYEAMKRVKVTS